MTMAGRISTMKNVRAAIVIHLNGITGALSLTAGATGDTFAWN
jgi:hypothetical protein